MKILLLSYFYAVFVILAFLADRLPFAAFIARLSALGRSSAQTIQSVSLGDAEKQKLLLGNSGLMLVQSAKLLMLVFIVLLLGLSLALLADIFTSGSRIFLMGYAETWHGALLSLLAFISFFCVKWIYVRVRL